MIAYEDLVAALKSWRARNGLPTTPPDYGDVGPVVRSGAGQAAPDEIYDLSDDSGLIVADDLQARDSEFAGEYDSPAQDQAYGGYGDDAAYGDQPMGAIQTGVEISTEGEAPRADDYDDPPGTDAYGAYASDDYAPDQYAQQYEDSGGYDAPADPYADAYGDPATDMHAGSLEQGTLDAGDDVVEEMDDDGVIGEEPLPGAYDDADDAALFSADEALEEATVVAGDPNELEPDALPEPPDDLDRN